MNTNIKNTLVFLSHYFIVNRGVGHTKTVLGGVVSNPEAFVVVGSVNTAKSLGIKNYITVDDVDKLRGCSAPLVFDNSGIVKILSEAAKHIHNLEQENKALQGKYFEYINKNKDFNGYED